MKNAKNPQESRPEILWARRRLRVQKQLAADELRGRFWNKVARDGFLPNEDACEAYELLRADAVGKPLAALKPCVSRALDDGLRVEVEGFAQGFFNLPPAERVSQWQSLVERCRRSPKLLKWLDALEPGLCLDTSLIRYGSAAQRQLSDQLLAVFVLPPSDAAARRHRIMSETRGDPKSARKVARLLRRSQPQIAGLDARFLNQLCRYQPAPMLSTQHARRVTKVRGRRQVPFWALPLILVVLGVIGSDFWRAEPKKAEPRSSSLPSQAELKARFPPPTLDAAGDIVVYLQKDLVVVARGHQRILKRSMAAAESLSQSYGEGEIVLEKHRMLATHPLVRGAESAYWVRARRTNPDAWARLDQWSRDASIQLSDDELRELTRAPIETQPGFLDDGAP